MKAVKMNRPNESIKCTVNSCFYYGNGDCCTADRIQVEPRDAHSIQETGCYTYTDKQI